MTNLSVRCGEVDHRKAVNERSSKEPHFLNLQNIYIHIYSKRSIFYAKQRCLELLFVFDKEKRRGKMDESGRGKWRMNKHLLFEGKKSRDTFYGLTIFWFFQNLKKI